MAWKRLWPDIERVAGKEATEDCVARAAMRVKDEIPPDEDEAESVVEEECVHLLVHVLQLMFLRQG
jgi:hypothetical protein